jgi:hypothetical protein
VHPDGLLGSENQPRSGAELLQPTCDGELVPRSEALSHARPVAVHVESLFQNRTAAASTGKRSADTVTAKSDNSMTFGRTHLTHSSTEYYDSGAARFASVAQPTDRANEQETMG